jgi:hypothetical protein
MRCTVSENPAPYRSSPHRIDLRRTVSTFPTPHFPSASPEKYRALRLPAAHAKIIIVEI